MQSKIKPTPVLSTRRSGLDRDIQTVEVDATFARVVGLMTGQKVGVNLHIDPPQAHTINIEPLDIVDWDMIELHAQFLELNFLQQVRALPNPAYSSPNEPRQAPHAVTLHLSPTSTANIVVTNLKPPPLATQPFVKISQDAEIIVAPKERKSQRASAKGSRSVASTGKRSASGRSGASTVRRRSSREYGSKGAVFLRGVTRALGKDWFDEDDSSMADVGLKAWVDRDILMTKAFRGAQWVLASVVKPVGLLEAVDPQKNAAETEKPAMKVIAAIGEWQDAPSSQHVALSSSLCSVLAAKNMVGGLVRIEVAPPQTPRAELKPTALSAKVEDVRQLSILPFVEPDHQSSGLKFGGDSKKEREEAVKRLKELLGKGPAGQGLLHGPVTDGMLLPAEGTKAGSWPGGILRFEPQTSEGGKATTIWLNTAERTVPIDLQAEIARPTQALRPWLAGQPLPDITPTLAGIDPFSDQLFSHLAASSSVLLTGGAGAGKTGLAHSIAHQLRSEGLYNTVYFPCRTLITDETRVSTVKETLSRLFACASWGARLGGRAIVILDDLDKLCPVETELQVGNDNSRSRHISECLVAVARQYCTMSSGVVLLATALSKEAINNVIVGGHVVREILNLPAPNKEGRRRVLEMLVQQDDNLRLSADAAQVSHRRISSTGASSGPSRPGTSSGQSGFAVSPSIDFLDLAGQTDGCMPGDLVVLVSRARSECLIRIISSNSSYHKSTSALQPTLASADFQAALDGFTPAGLRNVNLQSSTTKWSSIGGLQSTRQTLLETLQYPTIYAPIFAACPLRLRSGLLLYGFPGCGKTLLASAVASECGLNFISVKGPEILNKYIGASEQSVRDLFERAQAARPCVLFFDEFDAIAPKRGHDSTGVTDRVVNQLLTQMDGAEGLGEGVYILAATSRPDLIDPALLRPGRLDKALLCGMPNLQDRVDVLKAVSTKVKVSRQITEQRWRDVAARTDGFSGADLQALVYNAQLEAVHDVLGDHDLTTASKRPNGTSGVNGASIGASTGTPAFTYFRFGDEELEFEQDVEPKAMKERADIAQRLRDMAALRRRQKAQQKREHAALLAEATATAKPYKHQHVMSSDSDDGGEPRAPDAPCGNDEKAEEHDVDSKEPMIQWRHLETSLRTTRCSISPDERQRLGRIYREFVDGRSGELPNGEAGREIGGRTSLM